MTPLADGAAVAAAVKDLEAEDHQVVPVAVVGHKADVGFVALGPDLWRLRRFQTALTARARRGGQLRLAHGGVRVRRGHARGAQERPALPRLPPEGKPAFCFYPMSKRRGDVHNWYELPYDEREQLMYGHGGTGRTFAGRSCSW